MKVAVWDTYVKAGDGRVLHFDIIVPGEEKDEKKIFSYGQCYLQEIREAGAKLETEECQFCHVESPTEEMLDSISEKGFFILEMEDIPASLPQNPSRRDLILHLRAHSPEYRFANFRDKSDEEIKKINELLK